MAIYYKDLFIEAYFKDEIINENNFKGQIALLKLAIRVRDLMEGRSGNTTKHADSPSIKIINYGKGKSSTHSKDGDPVYFWMSDNKVQFSYNKNDFNSKEIKYIKNFIIHNFYHLSNYWFAPRNINNYIELEDYQNRIKERILYNIDNYNYYKKEYDIENEITI